MKAQQIFMKSVKIEFEKTVYLHPWMKETWGEQHFNIFSSQLATQQIHYFNYTANLQHSLYSISKTKKNEDNRFDTYTNTNSVFTDFVNNRVTAQKQFFDQTYFIQDSLLSIKWKITPDTRMIAGFECKKAIGILHDSIAVYAFYSDEILISGGPEQICGLPGMILGLGIPRLHTTWFATKVEVDNSTISPMIPSKKTKSTNYKEMVSEITNFSKQTYMKLVALGMLI